MSIPVDENGTFDYDNAFEACAGCKEVFWTFDIGRSGLCEACFEARGGER